MKSIKENIHFDINGRLSHIIKCHVTYQHENLSHESQKMFQMN